MSSPVLALLLWRRAPAHPEVMTATQIVVAAGRRVSVACSRAPRHLRRYRAGMRRTCTRICV